MNLHTELLVPLKAKLISQVIRCVCCLLLIPGSVHYRYALNQTRDVTEEKDMVEPLDTPTSLNESNTPTVQSFEKGQLQMSKNVTDTILQKPIKQSNARYKGYFKNVQPEFTRFFPLSNVVQLSNGCSGFLVTSLHVLTSAQCVYLANRLSLFKGALRVRVPDVAGYRIGFVKKISLPLQFQYGESEFDMLQFDFAVLTLSSQVARRRFIPLVSTSVAGPRDFKVLYYSGFKLGSKNRLITCASCRTRKADLRLVGDIFVSSCDVPAGLTGAAIIVKRASGLSILGITYPLRYAAGSIGVQFSPSKMSMVCEWLGDQGRKDGVCG